MTSPSPKDVIARESPYAFTRISLPVPGPEAALPKVGQQNLGINVGDYVWKV